MPSNENREGETIYETPFANDVSLDGTLPSNVSSINPYTSQNGYLLSGSIENDAGEKVNFVSAPIDTDHNHWYQSS